MSLEYRNDVEENETVEENENVRRVTPVFPLYSVVLIACLVAVSLCQFAVDGKDTIITGSNYSADLAGFVKLAFAQGEYWRILTGAVLHGGLIHLIFNCFALYQLGRLIEILSNRAHLATVFLLAAIGGGILSFIFLPSGKSVGASGGIIGFLGYLTIYGFKRRKLMPPDFLRSMIFNIAFIGFMGVFVIPNVDNFAHLGGLIVGIVYGFVQIPSDVYKDPRTVNKTSEILGLASLGAVIAISVFAILLLFKVA